MKKNLKIFAAASMMMLSTAAIAQTEQAEEVKIMEGNRVYVTKNDQAFGSKSYWRINMDKAVGGEALSMKGEKYEKGLGVHAPSKLVFDVPRKAQYFYVVPGPDDAHNGKITMSIKVDGEEVFTTGQISSKTKKYTPTLQQIDVAGAKQIELIVEEGADNGGDHADWVEAFFVEGKKEFKLKNPNYGAYTEDESLVYLTKEMATTNDSYWRVMNNEGVDGGFISISGNQFRKGLGVHSTSTMVFPVKDNYVNFVVTPGANDSNGGKIRMIIKIDGEEVYNSGTINSRKQTVEEQSFNVKGKKTITLICEDADDNQGGDHGSWGDARFTTKADSK
ncbi:NPCBM/NEW2 domain-containing protein [Flammeovirga yaeyamensis]|uniref:NPCBM/NEW2 domain-containing protein n=1 Tax=Flammeovirga yaeyamensis TaxID=367791 RepID=A0AAX1NAM0_9BACT|nr:NPCBM/NEW2 domain-containing protein [Flammeovirga yaeyamensis]MBB3699553.1 hypothetical protein [Flammeovirga yaeyamensis]NMF35192.1 hypothetical protein [Flammeovirga yaeyamensis]QWG04056.1 NPCBM/NEW2 domain-containing protein [Flammeovirga yaeyamensis]